jgi:hypothetical protein
MHHRGPLRDGDDVLLAGHVVGRHADALRNRGPPAGFFRLALPLMAAAVRRANRKDLTLPTPPWGHRTKRANGSPRDSP